MYLPLIEQRTLRIVISRLNSVYNKSSTFFATINFHFNHLTDEKGTFKKSIASSLVSDTRILILVSGTNFCCYIILISKWFLRLNNFKTEFLQYVGHVSLGFHLFLIPYKEPFWWNRFDWYNAMRTLTYHIWKFRYAFILTMSLINSFPYQFFSTWREYMVLSISVIFIFSHLCSASSYLYIRLARTSKSKSSLHKVTC